MTDDLYLRHKWTLRAHGRQVVFIKKANESARHVLMKAFLWALYLPDYPDLTVEIAIGDRYKPDVVALDDEGRPRFWGESGEVRVQKIRALARRYRSTHFALAKWDTRLDPYASIIKSSLQNLNRQAPIDLLGFPPDSAERFIADDGHIHITRADLDWIRWA
jgi:hypothetical protein